MTLPRTAVLLAALILPGCRTATEYLRLARPSVLSELTPPMARLVNEIPAVDRPNELTIAELYALGGLGRAEEGPDGMMRVKVAVRKGEYIWSPAIVVAPHGGVLELEFQNPDDDQHAADLPSNGARQYLELPPHSAGRMRVSLDGPGWYWFFCPVANHLGRNMFGYVLVDGEVAPEARLDRPAQPLPRD
jgi:PQQ system protein